MKVKFLKGHLRHKAGSVADVVAERGNYYVKCNVAVEVTEEVKPTAPKKTAPKKMKGK